MNGDESVKEKYGDFCLTPPVQPVYAGYLTFNLGVVSLIDNPDKSDEVYNIPRVYFLTSLKI